MQCTIWSGALVYWTGARIYWTLGKTAVLFSPILWKHRWDFVSALAWEGRSWLTWVQPEDTYRRWEVQMWGEVGVEQLYEKICNKSRSNFYFSCAFPIQICRSLLTKCLDPLAVLAECLQTLCMDVSASIQELLLCQAPSPGLKLCWSGGTVTPCERPALLPGETRVCLPRELTHAQISLPPWAWELQEPSWLLSSERPKKRPCLFGCSDEKNVCASGSDFFLMKYHFGISGT